MKAQEPPERGTGSPHVCKHCQGTFYAYRKARNYCSPKCYQEARAAAVPVTPCPQCGQPVRAKGSGLGRQRKFCSVDCRASYLSQERHPNWAGGRGVDSQGYVRVSVGRGERVREHRLEAAPLLGRPPQADEHVHHKDRDKMNNKPSNLEVLSPQEHGQLHGQERCPKPPIVCVECGRLRKHQARGLCKGCYNRANLEARRRRDPEGTKEAIRASNRRYYLKRKQTP